MEKTQVSRSILVTLAVVAFTCGGCRTIENGYLARTWSPQMRELGINPIFPPREDVQVGDIYLFPDVLQTRDGVSGYLPLGVWLDSANLSQELTSFYAARPSFPRTTTTNTQEDAIDSRKKDAAVIASQSVAGRGETSIFAGGDATRLRLVAFPAFYSVSATEADLAAAFPIQGVDAALGIHAGRTDAASISIPAAESCGLPLNQVRDAILKDGQFAVDRLPHLRLDGIAGFLPPRLAGTNSVSLIVITEVFYARSFDISIKSTKGFGLGGKVTPAATPATSEQTTNISTQPATPAAESPDADETQTETPTTDEAAERPLTPGELAERETKRLEGALAATTPGATFRFMAVGENGITLRGTFDRPIAVGYRGLRLNLEKSRQSWTVKAAGGVSTRHPLGRHGEKAHE